MLYWVHLTWEGFELATLVVIGTDCIGSYKSNYHTIMTAPQNGTGQMTNNTLPSLLVPADILFGLLSQLIYFLPWPLSFHLPENPRV